ncbi:hypothetical protein MUU46_10750 [Scandinavium sp. TWS1a]|uniref:hypothetical protein n=1 Tax=Scandinavium tedordense TaxID=2926521 RepID=UPI0021656037|nr:hypothetical protein [Scandinavium tedordense]MCS2170793.1 hypothetical protein [Scandinavium tedordense]
MDNRRFKEQAQPILQRALLYARSRLPLKAANKFYLNKNVTNEWMVTDPNRYLLHTVSMDKLRNQKLRELREHNSNPKHYCQKLDQDYRNGIKNPGNCGENAMLAFSYLANHVHGLQKKVKDPVRILRIYLKMPVDHALVLVGTWKGPGSHQLLENTLVCDPWAKIVCPIDTYSIYWQAKMKKWSDRGLKGYHGSQIYDFYQDRCTRESIIHGKVVLTEQALQGVTKLLHDPRCYSLMDRNVFS